jgi:diguanylate cyclase (GGDEF)-like protein
VLLVVLISVPLLGGARALVLRQIDDITISHHQIETVDLLRDVRDVGDALRPYLATRRMDADTRADITAALLKLDTDAYGVGAYYGTTDALKQVDAAWSATIAQHGAHPRISDMQRALAALSVQIANVTRSSSGAGGAAESLLDAYSTAIPAVGSEIAHGSPTRALDAFRDIASDFDRAYPELEAPKAAKIAVAQARDAIQKYIDASAGKTLTPRQQKPYADPVVAHLRALATIAADNARRLFIDRRNDQERGLILLEFGTAGVVIICVLTAILLARSIIVGNMRDFEHLRQERDRERIEMENERVRNALKSSEARFAALFDRASLGVAVLELSGAVARKNDAMNEMFPNASAYDLGARYPDFENLITGAITGFTYEIDASTPEKPRYLDFAVSLVNDENGVASFALSIAKDITERRENEARLMRESRFDTLVGLPNRNFLIEQMESMKLHKRQSDRPRGVLFIDVDGFKVVNDSLGHEIGDHVLVAAARRLEEHAGPLDFVSRFGGDEFVLILDGRGTREELVDAANKLALSLADPFDIGGREVYVGVSAGLAVCDRPYENVGAIIRDADTAMYHAKAAGRNRTAVFDNTMREAATRRLVLAAQLRRALERNQLYLAYQPVVRIAASKVTSLEVLMRWDHPTLGLVSPAEFIPVAEEIGLIVPFGRFMIDRACAQLVEWRNASDLFDNTRLNINASARELLQSDYVEMVVATVEKHELKPNDLTLEVTESTVLQGDRQSQSTLDRLKAAGFRLSIDDFGTGYSSLRYLQSFPFDQLKIDGSFVRGKGEGLASEAIVTMLIALGRAFDVTIVAEGVETKQQLAQLHTLGCEYLQGYLLEKPLVASKVPESVARLQAQTYVDPVLAKGSILRSRTRKIAHR